MQQILGCTLLLKQKCLISRICNSEHQTSI